MASSVDPEKIKEVHDALIEARDAVAEEINRLDADRRETEEFIAAKTRLMSRWRDLSIMRVQVAHAAELS